jgi:hypothetical protein
MNVLLIQALREPSRLAGLGAAEWDLLIRQARHSRLVGRLAVLVEQYGVSPPDAAGAHLRAARHVADSQHSAVLWESKQICRALSSLEVPLLLLKGAAYAQAGLRAGHGRLLTDIDILVPLSRISDVETELILHGWEGSEELSDHDQRYYREWMHEIPPMRHMRRSSVIDVHHNILPRTARVAIDAERLIAAAVPIPGAPGLLRLSDADLVLHSACHLFLDGEFDKGLRDLLDLDSLLREFSSQQLDFASNLIARAAELGLGRVLFYALRYTHSVLGTPVPPETTQALAEAAPPAWQLSWMDAVFLRALRPDHPSCDDGWSSIARSFLYLRAHWMRMPIHLLLPHLAIKTFAGRFGKTRVEAREGINAAGR